MFKWNLLFSRFLNSFDGRLLKCNEDILRILYGGFLLKIMILKVYEIKIVREVIDYFWFLIN